MAHGPRFAARCSLIETGYRRPKKPNNRKFKHSQQETEASEHRRSSVAESTLVHNELDLERNERKKAPTFRWETIKTLIRPSSSHEPTRRDTKNEAEITTANNVKMKSELVRTGKGLSLKVTSSLTLSPNAPAFEPLGPKETAEVPQPFYLTPGGLFVPTVSSMQSNTPISLPPREKKVIPIRKPTKE